MLTLHTAPLLLPPGAEPLPDGAVLVQGEAVLAVGPRADLAAAHPGARTRAWPGLLTTGLTHTRAAPCWRRPTTRTRASTTRSARPRSPATPSPASPPTGPAGRAASGAASSGCCGTA